VACPTDQGRAAVSSLKGGRARLPADDDRLNPGCRRRPSIDDDPAHQPPTKSCAWRPQCVLSPLISRSGHRFERRALRPREQPRKRGPSVRLLQPSTGITCVCQTNTRHRLRDRQPFRQMSGRISCSGIFNASHRGALAPGAASTRPSRRDRNRSREKCRAAPRVPASRYEAGAGTWFPANSHGELRNSRVTRTPENSQLGPDHEEPALSLRGDAVSGPGVAS
jgi:hypothetical protein